MSNSTRYYQLTPEILMEYNYSDRDVMTNQSGDKSEFIFDMLGNDGLPRVKIMEYAGVRNFVFDDDRYLDGLVLPLKDTTTRFIQYSKNSNFTDIIAELDEGVLNRNNSDIVCDHIKIHFTSRNYLEDYLGFILRATISDSSNNRITLLSHYIKRTDNLQINENPLLINQKLYTTYLEFSLPSPDALINLNSSSSYNMANKWGYTGSRDFLNEISENDIRFKSVYESIVENGYNQKRQTWEVYTRNISQTEQGYEFIINTVFEDHLSGFGYAGDKSDWTKSVLKGTYPLVYRNGYGLSRNEWENYILSIESDDVDTLLAKAYEHLQENGFTGDEDKWHEILGTPDGLFEESVFEKLCHEGFTGDRNLAANLVKYNLVLAPGEDLLKSLLENNKGRITSNSIFNFDIYGVRKVQKDSLNINTFYVAERFNSKDTGVSIPITDSFNRVSIDIRESNNGDYFEIRPVVSDGVSFSDYIYNLSDGYPDSYTVAHELSLIENYLNSQNKVISQVTHREHYVANAADTEGYLNENGLDHVMIYRPVVMNSGRLLNFIIEDKMMIINKLDNTTIVKTGSYTSSENGLDNPKKYGKHLSKIYLGQIPAQVNVYNKRGSDFDYTEETGPSASVSNGGSAPKMKSLGQRSQKNITIENHQYSITAFIECINVGASIEQIPSSYVED